MSNPVPGLNIIIVGGSVAGLASAIALKTSGHNVLVLEKNPGLGGNGFITNGGAQVPPNGSKILFDWGLEKTIRDFAAISDGFAVHEYNEIHAPHLSFIGTNRWDPELLSEARGPFVQFRHEDLVRILYDAALKLPERLEHQLNLNGTGEDSTPVSVIFGAEVVNVDCDAGSVTLQSGVVHKGDVIIGADGARGVVRQTLMHAEGAQLPLCDVPTGLSLYGATIPGALAKNEDPNLAVFFKYPNNTVWVGSNRAAMTFCTGKDNDIAIVLYTPDSPQDGSWTEAADKCLSDVVGPCDVQLQKFVDLAGPATCLKIQDRYDLESWVSKSGKVMVLGEAAHPFPPAAVQSYSVALKDGAFIGKIFSHTRDPDRIPELLNAFQEHREPRCSRIRKQEEQIIRTVTSVDEEAQVGREAAMRASQAAGRNVMDSGDLQEMHDELREVFGYDPADDADEWWMNWGRWRQSKEGTQRDYISWEAVSSETRYVDGDQPDSHA